MEDNTFLLVMRELMGNLAKEEREKILECAARLRGVLAEYPEHGTIALALASAEMSGEVIE